jgi:uncharacterized Zn finger protein
MARWRDGWYGDGGFDDYVSAATKRARAEKKITSLKKRGAKVSPVVLAGTRIASTFWGKAWCENLERYSDFSNRLPRGRTYVRNGAVIDLGIERGRVVAQVQGTHLYRVEVDVGAVTPPAWKAIVRECAGQIASVVELLSGKLSKAVMEIVTRKGAGLFPAATQIRMRCSCPDGATMCKHIAAALYGVGARLDTQPELLFVLRHVDAAELAGLGVTGLVKDAPATARRLSGDLASIFGLELAPSPSVSADPRRSTTGTKRAARRTPAQRSPPRTRKKNKDPK